VTRIIVLPFVLALAGCAPESMAGSWTMRPLEEEPSGNLSCTNTGDMDVADDYGIAWTLSRACVFQGREQDPESFEGEGFLGELGNDRYLLNMEGENFYRMVGCEWDGTVLSCNIQGVMAVYERD
jgi:hypothetical protein